MKIGEFKPRSGPGVRAGVGLLLIGVVMAGWGFWHLAEFMQANGTALRSTTPFRGRVVLDAMLAVFGVVALLRGVRALLAR